MATVKLSAFLGPGNRVLLANGQIAVNSNIYTYSAGTLTPANTYTDTTGTVLNLNPIPVGSDGYPKNNAGNTVEIWQLANSNLKIVLTDSTNVAFPGGTFDGIPGINDVVVPGAANVNSAPYILLTTFSGIQAGNSSFDNSPGIQAALNSLNGTGVQLVVPPGTYYMASGVTLNGDNVLKGYNMLNTTFQAIAPFTMFTLKNSILSTPDCLSNFTLVGSNANNAASIAIQLGTPNSGSNYTLKVSNIYLTTGWYLGVTGTAELDGSVLDHIQSFTPFGLGFIDIELNNPSATPSAGLTIQNCHAAQQGNSAFGMNRVGIRIQGTDDAWIHNNIINGFDVDISILSGNVTSIGAATSTYSTLIQSNHIEDFRSFVMDYSPWTATASKSAGVATRVVSTSNNGFVFNCFTSGVTAGIEPTWNVAIGSLTTDGSVVWQNQGYQSRRWTANTSYPAGYLAKATKANSFGFIFQSSGGISGSSEPSWGNLGTLAIGSAVSDNGITWTAVHSSIGIQKQSGTTGIKCSQNQVANPLVQYALSSGRLHVEGSEGFTTSQGTVYSDVAFSFYGAFSRGYATFENCNLFGNFQPYLNTPNDGIICPTTLINTVVNNDLVGAVDVSGNGRFTYWTNGNQEPYPGTLTVSGNVTLTPASHHQVQFLAPANVVIANTNNMYAGKTLRLLNLSANTVNISLANSASMGIGGTSIANVQLTQSEEFIDLMCTGVSWHIVDSTKYIPAVLNNTVSSGANSGTFTSGSWTPRTFNAKNDLSNFVSNVGASWTGFTLLPGIYKVQAVASAYAVDKNQLRLYDATANNSLGSSAGQVANSSTGGTSLCQLSTVITIPLANITNNIQLQHQCQTTSANTGFGLPANFGSSEVYAQLVIEKLI